MGEGEGGQDRGNWARSYSYTAPRIERPGSVAEIARILRESDGPVHALGTRHSFTDLPDTAGTLIDLAGLVHPTGASGSIRIDDDARTATVPAWMRYGVVAPALEERGWALHNMGSLPHISVGGAIATGTHGSGDRNGTLSSAVSALRFLDARGEEHEVRRGDEDFDALVVGVGAFGITTQVTLDLQHTYRVRQDIYAGITWDALLDDLEAVTGAGYSVSVFTNWEADEVGHVWVKTRLSADDDAVPDILLDGRREPDDSPLGSGDNITVLGGVPGPWMLRLPHFRLDREPSYGAEIQTEYFVDRTDAPDALQAVRELAPAIAPHLAVTELRTMARDDELWLSPAYRRDALAIHFTWLAHPLEVGRVIPLIEAALAPFAARPHWGKVHAFDAERLAAVHPRIADARAVFDRLDPDGRFVNAHLERLGVRSSR